MLQEAVDGGNDSYNLFTGVKIIGSAIDQLREVGFDEDFISKLEGQKQYVTIGMVAILLAKTRDLVAAPMARVFLNPKSYFRPRIPLFSTKYFFNREWFYSIVDRTDLNVGYTVVESKLDGVKTNFVLAGVSFEANKAALINFGWDIPVNAENKKNGQLYFGLTVDSNILKGLGIVSK
jgi:hypothetical protein